MYRTHWLAAVFLFVWASAASAGVKPYQEFASASGCTFQGDCAIVFPAVTAQTLILHASCAFTLANGASISFASLGTQNDNQEMRFNSSSMPIVSRVTGSTPKHICSSLRAINRGSTFSRTALRWVILFAPCPGT